MANSHLPIPNSQAERRSTLRVAPSGLGIGSWDLGLVRLLHPDRRLLVVGLARDRIECALRDLVRVGLGVMKRHEHLAWRHRLRDTQLQAAHATAPRYD